MTFYAWNGSLSINNLTGGTLHYAVSAGTGTVAVPTAFGTISPGNQTISNLPQATGKRIYFSNQKLTDSLFNASNPVNPSPSGPDWNKLYSFWEYSYDANGFTWDVSDVEESSYPLQTTSQGINFGVASWSTLLSELIAQPSFAPLTGKGEVSDLIWSSEPSTAPNGETALPLNSRIIGPEFLWQAQQGGQDAVNLLPTTMQNFLADVPWNGTDLVTPEYKNQGWLTNWDVWQYATDIQNGYTEAIASAAVTGPQPQLGTPSDFRGVFTYPQDEAWGQVTYGPIPTQIIINPGEISASTHIFGTSSNDQLQGNAGDNIISGGYGGDRMSGSAGSAGNAIEPVGGGQDQYLYVRADSSLQQRGLRDVITDFGLDDTINLSRVDANSRKGGSQPFRWIRTREFSHKTGQLRIEYGQGSALLQGDTNGDGRTDFEVKLREVEIFSRTNLILT